VRADLKPIRLRCQVEKPDALIILDPTLLDDPATLTGLASEGWVVVNTDLDPAALPIPLAFRVAAVDANGIALRHGLGSASAPIVNTAILGAFAQASGVVSLPALRAAASRVAPARNATGAGSPARTAPPWPTGSSTGWTWIIARAACSAWRSAREAPSPWKLQPAGDRLDPLTVVP
jgi:hypothetical protein